MLLVHSHSKPLHEKSSCTCYVILTDHLAAQDSTYYVLPTLEASEIGSLCDFWGTHRFSHYFSDCHQVLSLKNPVFYTLIPSPILACVYIYVFLLLFFIFLHRALFNLSPLILKLYKHNYERFWFLETNVQKFSLHKCYGEILYACDFLIVGLFLIHWKKQFLPFHWKHCPAQQIIASVLRKRNLSYF